MTSRSRQAAARGARRPARRGDAVAARGPGDAMRPCSRRWRANSGPLLALLALAYWPARTVVTAPVRTAPADSAEVTVAV